jgi:hypothetical protein
VAHEFAAARREANFRIDDSGTFSSLAVDGPERAPQTKEAVSYQSFAEEGYH